MSHPILIKYICRFCRVQWLQPLIREGGSVFKSSRIVSGDLGYADRIITCPHCQSGETAPFPMAPPPLEKLFAKELAEKRERDEESPQYEQERMCEPYDGPKQLIESVKVAVHVLDSVRSPVARRARKILITELNALGIDYDASDDRPKPPSEVADAEVQPLTDFPKMGTYCAICGMPQHRSPGGALCKNGHGGAAPLACCDKPRAHRGSRGVRCVNCHKWITRSD